MKLSQSIFGDDVNQVAHINCEAPRECLSARMPIKRGVGYRAAIILVMLACQGVALAGPGAILSQNGGNQQKEKKDGENVAPQDSEYDKTDPSQYVGPDTCKGCHEDEGNSLDRGPHLKINIARHHGPQWQGCEACHGPGKQHAESADPSRIIRFPGLSREEASKRCLGCHEFGEEHADFRHLQHTNKNAGCVDCHSIHHPTVERKLLKAARTALCDRCHSHPSRTF